MFVFVTKRLFSCTTISYQLESTPFDVFSLNFEGALLITFYNNVFFQSSHNVQYIDFEDLT